jgi:anhydro-N-acetylmuramic acid kinase
MTVPIHCLGLMSGTSLDGVDAALIVTDGEAVLEPGPALTLPYPEPLRARLRGILGGKGPVADVERDVTLFHAHAAEALIAKHGNGWAKIDLVGFHGHTILHRPGEGRTWQIGDGALLARQLGIAVVNDFRTADVAAGGQGAPLAPIYHQALATHLPRSVAVLNLGGVGNLTFIGEGDALLAFDTGPANALIDDWALKHTGTAVDHGGRLAAAGRVNQESVARFLSHPYFDQRPPKSLDRDDFKAMAGRLTDGLSAEDGAATLTEFTVRSVAAALPHLPARPLRWLVTGGGRHNPRIMAGLAAALAAPVEPIEAIGENGDALEAHAFAYMAARTARGLPITFPGTTGVKRPLGGGRLHRPNGS